jgi:hypothetical protein
MYDNNNSGWNNGESTLTVTNAPQLGVLASSNALDDQVDTAPLIYGNNLYLATANNTLYEIDATNGTILKTRNFGTPVPAQPGCLNNSTGVGITGTPVIDPSTNTIYLVAYSYPSSVPTYTIYGVDKDTLNDKITPQVINVTATLSDATTYAFNPARSRQRAALKMSGNNIYVAFASFCDFNASTTRGWIMAFNKTTLSLAVANGYLINQIHPDTVDTPAFYLTSVWMSGAGPAIDVSGNVFVSTGNSGSTGSLTTYNQTKNLQESIIKFTPSLAVSDYLSAFDLINKDINDLDVSSGGVMLLPPVTGATHPNVIINAGKDGIWRFMDQTNMGHFNGPAGPDNILTQVGGATCFCAPAEFTGSDNVLRVVLPNGPSATTYKITAPGGTLTTTFDKNLGGGTLPTTGDGFFTTVSSNGIVPGSQIVWLISRTISGPGSNNPINNTPPTLFAFDAINGTQLFRWAMADWVNQAANNNSPPIVANGKVYVAGYKSFIIFGFPAPTTYVGPGDVAPGALFWGGLRAYTQAAAASGTQKLVQITNLSSGETCDILAATNGDIGILNSCSMGGSGSAATYCTVHSCGVSKLYDQSGSGLNLTQSSTIAMPGLKISCLNSKPCMVFVAGTPVTNFLANNSFPTVAQPNTYATVANTVVGDVFQDIMSNGNQQLYLHSTGAFGIIAGVNVEIPIPIPGWFNLQSVFNGVGSILSIDGGSTTVNPGAGALASFFSMGSFNTSGSTNIFSGNIVEFGAWAAAWNSTQLKTMCHNQWLHWGTGAQC